MNKLLNNSNETDSILFEFTRVTATSHNNKNMHTYKLGIK